MLIKSANSQVIHNRVFKKCDTKDKLNGSKRYGAQGMDQEAIGLSGCTSCEERSLGVCNLKQTMQAFQTKLAWNYVQGQSLWALIGNTKYEHPIEALERGVNKRHSDTWKMIFSLFEYIIKHKRWLIKEGVCSFQEDNWLDQMLWYLLYLDPKIIVKEAMQNQDFVNAHLSRE